MALAFRPENPRLVHIRLSRADLAVARPLIALVVGQPEQTGQPGQEGQAGQVRHVGHPVAGAMLKGDLITVDDALCQVERFVCLAGGGPLGLLVRDQDGVLPDHLEPLVFHQSFFLPFFDYARAVPQGGAHQGGQQGAQQGGYAKPGLLAVFTHAFDDGQMLRYWVDHHARLAGIRNLYVIDHGSSRPLRDELPPEVNVVPLPRALVDHADMARFCGHFQRFLLSQYRYVLHTDADELLADEQGEEGLRQKLARGLLSGILAPQGALEVIHDVRSEPALRPGEPISRQRRLALPGHWTMVKPVLADRPASWRQGFHQVYEDEAVRQVRGLWLIHLHAADARLLREKNRRWNAAAQTGADRLISPQSRPESKDELARWYAEKLGDEKLAPLPEVLVGRF